LYKSVLITGASSGIGEAIAVRLAAEGFPVWAGARRQDRLASLEGLGGGRIRSLALDVTSPQSIAAAFDRIGSEGPPLFAVVNNAGVSVTGPIEETPIAEWRRQFETNLFGLVAVTQAALPAFRAARSGRVVNIGSLAGRIVSPFMGVYAASKHAVEAVSDGLRRELRPFGVKVSLIRPGFINTPFGEQEQHGLAPYAEPGRPYAEQVASFKAWHAKGHPNGAPPSRVADAVRHALTSARPHSRYTVPAKYIGPLMLRNLLPSAAVDRIFERVIGLK